MGWEANFRQLPLERQSRHAMMLNSITSKAPENQSHPAWPPSQCCSKYAGMTPRTEQTNGRNGSCPVNPLSRLRTGRLPNHLGYQHLDPHVRRSPKLNQHCLMQARALRPQADRVPPGENRAALVVFRSRRGCLEHSIGRRRYPSA